MKIGFLGVGQVGGTLARKPGSKLGILTNNGGEKWIKSAYKSGMGRGFASPV